MAGAVSVIFLRAPNDLMCLCPGPSDTALLWLGEWIVDLFFVLRLRNDTACHIMPTHVLHSRGSTLRAVPSLRAVFRLAASSGAVLPAEEV